MSLNFRICKAVGHNGLISLNGLGFAQEGTKQVKPELGIDCCVVSGIEYSIASINEFFGMTDNYSRGLQIMLLGR